jgi:hypothetical protein
MGLTRAILTIGAVLAAAVALAGCGGSGGSNAAGTVGATVGTTGGTVSGTVGGSSSGTTTGGVAGVQTTQVGGSFSAQAQSLQAQIRKAMNKLANGDVPGAATAAGSLLTSCQDTVNNRLAPRANTTSQRQAVSHLRTACQDVSNASQQAASGNLSSAKQLAKQALDEAQQASSSLGG